MKSGTALKNILSYRFPKAPPIINANIILSVKFEIINV